MSDATPSIPPSARRARRLATPSVAVAIRVDANASALGFDDALGLVAAAEEAGASVAFLVGPDGPGAGRLAPALVLLAAAARRAHRIGLGTVDTQLALGDPLRLAEDAAVLDELSGGRVQLGVARTPAGSPLAAAFDGAGDHVADRFDDGLALVHDALGGRALRGTALILEPQVPTLRQRVWQFVRTDDDARLAAFDGDGIIVDARDASGGTSARIAAYRAAAAEPSAPHGRDAHGASPRIAVIVTDLAQVPTEVDLAVIDLGGGDAQGRILAELVADGVFETNVLRDEVAA